MILLSQILNFDAEPDAPDRSIRASTCPISWRCRPTRRPPGITTSCPSAARRPRGVPGEVEQFAMGDYARALCRRVRARPANDSACRGREAAPATPACRSTTCSRPTCASPAASSRRSCSGAGGPDHRAARHPLLRSRHGSAGSKDADYDPQAVGALLGLRLRVQRLRAPQAAAIGDGKSSSPASGRSATWDYKHQPPGAR